MIRECRDCGPTSPSAHRAGDRVRWFLVRFGWLVAPVIWIVHAVLHALGIAHIEGAWWWL